MKSDLAEHRVSWEDAGLARAGRRWGTGKFNICVESRKPARESLPGRGSWEGPSREARVPKPGGERMGDGRSTEVAGAWGARKARDRADPLAERLAVPVGGWLHLLQLQANTQTASWGRPPEESEELRALVAPLLPSRAPCLHVVHRMQRRERRLWVSSIWGGQCGQHEPSCRGASSRKPTHRMAKQRLRTLVSQQQQGEKRRGRTRALVPERRQVPSFGVFPFKIPVL